MNQNFMSVHPGGTTPSGLGQPRLPDQSAQFEFPQPARKYPNVCPLCGGSGKRLRPPYGYGTTAILDEPCNGCGGSGIIIC